MRHLTYRLPAVRTLVLAALLGSSTGILRAEGEADVLTTAGLTPWAAGR